MSLRLRNLKPGAYFILKRTGERYQFLGHKRDTPGGTQYVVRRSGFAKPTTMHHSCHVELLEDANFAGAEGREFESRRSDHQKVECR